MSSYYFLIILIEWKSKYFHINAFLLSNIHVSLCIDVVYVNIYEDIVIFLYTCVYLDILIPNILSDSSSVYVCMCIYICIWAHKHTHTRICVCVCVNINKKTFSWYWLVPWLFSSCWNWNI